MVVVDRMRATTASRLTSGRPRQFWVMCEKSRCSILFHLLVPGGKWGREVADVDRHVEFVGEPLEPLLPDMRPMAVAAARVGRDEDLAGVGVALRADLAPPRLDRRNREHRRIVIDAHAHEAVVGRDVIDAVGDRLAERVGKKIVDIDPVGFALGLPFASPVLEVADEFLLLGVDGDHRDSPRDAVLGLGVDVFELRVAIRMLGAFDGLVRRLKAVAMVAEQLGHRPVTDANAVLLEQLGGQDVRALARPT